MGAFFRMSRALRMVGRRFAEPICRYISCTMLAAMNQCRLGVGIRSGDCAMAVYQFMLNPLVLGGAIFYF